MATKTTLRIPAGGADVTNIGDYAKKMRYLQKAVHKLMLKDQFSEKPLEVEVIGSFDHIDLKCVNETRTCDIVQLYERCAAARLERLRRVQMSVSPATSR